jgi:hypothetical protein
MPMEPFGADASAPSDLYKSAGDALGHLGNVVGRVFKPAIPRGLRGELANQRSHEAQMQQKAHENNLELLDRIHSNGMTSDAHKQGLQERNREHILKSVGEYGEGRFMGGRHVDVQTTAEGGFRMSYSQKGVTKKKKPATSPAPVPAAPKTAKPRAPKQAAPKKAAPKPKTGPNGTEIINIVPPGEQYND